MGGKMVLLSKVFPTLDCASCISTPKMAATVHHPNVTVFTYSEVERIDAGRRRDVQGSGSAEAALRGRSCLHGLPRVRERLSGSCSRPVQRGHGRAARRLHPLPAGRAAEGADRARRHVTLHLRCPAGIKAHGYVALVRSGEYEKAFELVLEATPLVGSLGRACYAPCEDECTRGSLEGPLPIRRLKRFIADRHYAAGAVPRQGWSRPNGKKVAIVGSGPAGLTAAWQLALKGYGVKIFEAAPEPGGMLRLGHSRLPPPGRGGRARHRQRHGARGRDRDRIPASMTSRSCRHGIRRHTSRDRHTGRGRARRSGRRSAWRSPARSTSCAGFRLGEAPDLQRQRRWP